MSDKAIEVINHAARELDISMPFGEVILAALKAAGIELVELPEALVRERHNECEWRVDDTVVIRDGFGVTTVHIDDDWMDLGAQPGQLRRLAAALLAAANAAEAVE